MLMTMDENGSNSPQSFKDLRAKFEQINATKSSPSELGNTNKFKRSLELSNHELVDTVVVERRTAATLKKCSSELSQHLNQCRPPIPKKPDFLKSTTNGSSSSVHEIIERLNNANIPLAGSLTVNRESNELNSNASTSELSENSDEQPGKLGVRYGSFMQFGTMPRQVIEEMKANGHFKKIPSIRSKIPEGVGCVRAQRTRRMISQLPADSEKFDSWCSSAPVSICLKESPNESGSPPHSDFKNKPVSIVGSSSNSSEDTVFETYEYYGKDEEENRRCSELHGVVYEICCRQRTFLRLLTNICKELVPFIKKVDEKSSHKAFIPPSHGPHILEKLSKQLETILGIHEVLYEEFSKKFAIWSALTPNFAEIFNKHADFLKICSGFLLAKRDLTDELLTAMDQNKYLAHAIRLFEEEVLNAPEGGNTNPGGSSTSIPQGGGISLVMHLDAVHQNVVRYILLMERYKKLLPNGVAECDVANKAISKLKSVSKAIDCSLMDPDYIDNLMEIHRKLQGAFDVLSPTRRLVHEGRLMKQARKELQERHLVLFTDWIIVGRYTYPFDYFDPIKSYRLRLIEIQIRTEDHVDYENEFVLINPRKTTTFVAKSKKERDAWVEIIQDTRNKWLETERNLQEQRCKLSVAPTQVTRLSIHDENKTPTDPNVDFAAPKDQTPTNGDTTIKIPTQSGPVWIPDSKATKCMMAECELKFTKIKRRHHCRNCGYLICSNCTGRAPVKVKNFESEKVCSDCYDRIMEDFIQLVYFPPSMVQLTDKGLNEKLHFGKNAVHPIDEEETKTVKAELIDRLRKDPFEDTIRIKFDTKAMHPRDLFKEPTNKHYHRTQTNLETVANPRNSHESTILISGKVHLMQKKGHSTVRWARLDSDFSLNFYEAELDAVPVDTFFLFGYSLFINDNSQSQSGTEFILVHQNQIKTERKDLKVVFRVGNRTAAEGWKEALVDKLELPIIDQKDI